MMKVDTKEYLKNLYIVFSLRYASIFLLLVVIFLAWSKYFGFAVNASHSLPHTLYLIQKSRNHLADLKQGDYVAYAWQGEFYPVGTQMVKRVAGLPGDTVSRSGREFFVNGTAVGRAKEFSLKGAPWRLLPLRAVSPNALCGLRPTIRTAWTAVTKWPD